MPTKSHEQSISFGLKKLLLAMWWPLANHILTSRTFGQSRSCQYRAFSLLLGIFKKFPHQGV